MIFLRRVKGQSMLPALRDGQIVICHEIRDYKPGQVVVAFVRGREVVKRIVEIENGKIYLAGDNKEHAHNGKYYATVVDSKIVGVVLWPRVK